MSENQISEMFIFKLILNSKISRQSDCKLLQFYRFMSKQQLYPVFYTLLY